MPTPLRDASYSLSPPTVTPPSASVTTTAQQPRAQRSVITDAIDEGSKTQGFEGAGAPLTAESTRLRALLRHVEGSVARSTSTPTTARTLGRLEAAAIPHVPVGPPASNTTCPHRANPNTGQAAEHVQKYMV
eukprot:6794514-Prymnesium_polylepis.4